MVSVNLSPEINISPDEALPPIDTENEASTDGVFFIVATALRSTSAAEGVAEVLARHTVVVSMVKMMRSLVYSFIIMDNKNLESRVYVVTYVSRCCSFERTYNRAELHLVNENLPGFPSLRRPDYAGCFELVHNFASTVVADGIPALK